MDNRSPFSPARMVGARHGKRLTQKALGATVDRSPYTIRGYEIGDRTPSAAVEAALCAALDLAPDGLRQQYADRVVDYFAAVADVTGTDLDLDAATAAATVLPRTPRGRASLVGGAA